MKKHIRSIALVLVLVTVFTLPASASGVDGSVDPFVNLLDYGSIGGTGELYTSVAANGTFTFDLDMTTQLSYIDMVVRINGVTPTAIQAKLYSSAYTTLTMQSIGNYMYRIYGRFGTSYADDQITFKFTSAGTSRVTIVSFKASIGYYTSVGETTRMTIENYETKVMHSAAMSAAGSSTSLQITYTSDQLDNTYLYPLDLYVYFEDWTKYDYGQISIKLEGIASLDSLAVQFNGSYVPFEASYLDVNASDSMNQFKNWEFPTNDTSGGYLYFNESSVVYLNIRADFSALQRTTSGEPVIRILGQQAKGTTATITLVSYDGIIVQEGPGWLARISYLWREQYAMISAGFENIGNILGTRFEELITSVNALPDKIAEAISSVFQPTEGKMEQMQQQSQELAQERLGAVYQVVEVVDSVAGAFTVQEVQGSISVPACTVMLSGVPFTFGGWEVQVVPDGFDDLVELCKYVIDIVCTLAFVNGMKKRFEGFLGGDAHAG